LASTPSRTGDSKEGTSASSQDQEALVKSKLIISAAVLVLLSLTVAVQAASVVKLTLPDLVKQSQAIVIGKVSGVSSAWVEDRRQIFTTITLNVSENLKGSSGHIVTFTQIGGVVGDTRVSVAGAPIFTPGSEVLLFLSGDPSGYFPTVGMGQGKFDVTTDERSGEKIVINSVLGLHSPAGAPLSSSETTRMTINQIKTAVAQALSADGESE
jgi:hypothetical protein